MRTIYSVPLVFSVLLLLSNITLAAEGRPVKKVGEYKIYYNVVHSQFIEPGVAAEYGLSRADDLGVVNISIVREGESTYGIPAKLSGSVDNVLGQKQSLEFFAVKDGAAVYYIAQFNYFYEMPLEFSVEVAPEDGSKEFDLRFEETFYRKE